MIKLKVFIFALVVSLGFASCTKYDANNIPLPQPAYKCSSDMDNSFKGYIDDPYIEGTMALLVNQTGTMGSVAMVNITAFLSVNGQDFCCNSAGANTMELMYPLYNTERDFGALSAQSLICTPTSTGFQQFTLKLGVECGYNSLHKMYLTKDNMGAIGCFTLDNPIMQNRVIAVVN